ncbi:Flp pilus assembly protein CpaB [Neobacillus sp. LXY-4]|uniref:Flp pilus assembly protein CpaB n=1 Tax=Neobacillus sp. LXY-4 TaxID=3379826 RepID=UPI003EE1936C
MNTKKIWIMSLIFGVLMAFVAYIAIFSGKAEKTASDGEIKKSEEVQNAQTAKAKETVTENPMEKVSEGKRAISLKTLPEAGISGYIERNAHVDVVAYETTVDENTKKKFKSSVLVLQNIKVLAIGKSSDTGQEALDYQTVTLEVTPDQGLMLSLASKDKDGFYFMLRNTKDKGEIEEMKRSTREVIEEGKDK